MRCVNLIFFLLLISTISTAIRAEDPSPQESGCYEFLQRFPHPFSEGQGAYHFHANGFSFLFYEDGRAYFSGLFPGGHPWRQPATWRSGKGTFILEINYHVDISYQCERQCTQFDYPSNVLRFNQWQPEYPFPEEFKTSQIARCQKYCYQSVPETYGKVEAQFPVVVELKRGQGGYPGWVAIEKDDPQPVPDKKVMRFPFFEEWTPFNCDYAIVEEESK